MLAELFKHLMVKISIILWYPWDNCYSGVNLNTAIFAVYTYKTIGILLLINPTLIIYIQNLP